MLTCRSCKCHPALRRDSTRTESCTCECRCHDLARELVEFMMAPDDINAESLAAVAEARPKLAALCDAKEESR